MRGHPSKKDVPRPLGMREQLEKAMKKARKQTGDSPEGRALETLMDAFSKVTGGEKPAKKKERPGRRKQVSAATFETWLEHANIGDTYSEIGDRRSQLGAAAREQGIHITVEMAAVVRGPKSDPTVDKICVATRVEKDPDETARDPGADE